MRLGLLAYATDTGLGNQTRNIYEYLKPHKTMLVDISKFNHLPVHDEWYQYHIRTNGYPSREEIDSFLYDLDIIIICESPLNYYLIERANSLGIKTVLQYNYEFLDYYNGRDLPKPTVFAAPTTWNIDKVRSIVNHRTDLLNVPVDTAKLPQRNIVAARHFFHIAGRPAVYDRNGTNDFIAAVRMLHSIIDAKYTIYCQNPTKELQLACEKLPIDLISHVDDYQSMYEHGDVLVLPRRYGGLCLPAQEAIGCGIPVIMPDVSPNNEWLPACMLTPVSRRVESFKAHTPVDMYKVDVIKMAQRMADLSRHPEAVEEMVREALIIREALSWDRQESIYRNYLESLCI